MSRYVYIFEDEKGKLWCTRNDRNSAPIEVKEFFKGLDGFKDWIPVIRDSRCTIIECPDSNTDFQWIPGISNKNFYAQQYKNNSEAINLILLDRTIASKWFEKIKVFPQFCEPLFIPSSSDWDLKDEKRFRHFQTLDKIAFRRTAIVDLTHWAIQHRKWVLLWLVFLVVVQGVKSSRSSEHQSLIAEYQAMTRQIQVLEGKRDEVSQTALSTPRYTHALDQLNGLRSDKVRWSSASATIDWSDYSTNSNINVRLLVQFDGWSSLNQWISDIKKMNEVKQCIIQAVDENKNTASIQIKITV